MAAKVRIFNMAEQAFESNKTKFQFLTLVQNGNYRAAIQLGTKIIKIDPSHSIKSMLIYLMQNYREMQQLDRTQQTQESQSQSQEESNSQDDESEQVSSAQQEDVIEQVSSPIKKVDFQSRSQARSPVQHLAPIQLYKVLVQSKSPTRFIKHQKQVKKLTKVKSHAIIRQSSLKSQQGKSMVKFKALPPLKK